MFNPLRTGRIRKEVESSTSIGKKGVPPPNVRQERPSCLDLQKILYSLFLSLN